MKYSFEEHSHSHNHTHNVTIKKAPTDESIRLLKEMEEKVLANVLATKITHEMESIGAEFVSLSLDPMMDVKTIICKINGNVVKAEVPTKQLQNRSDYAQVVAQLLAEAILMQLHQKNQEMFR